MARLEIVAGRDGVERIRLVFEDTPDSEAFTLLQKTLPAVETLDHAAKTEEVGSATERGSVSPTSSRSPCDATTNSQDKPEADLSGSQPEYPSRRAASRPGAPISINPKTEENR